MKNDNKRNCPNCRGDIEDGCRYCPYCGQYVPIDDEDLENENHN